MVTAVLLGAGNRGRVYARYAQAHPDKMRIVAIAEPEPKRRAALARETGLTDPGQLYDSWEALLEQPRMADAVINATMDRLHYDSTLAALEQGYHVLLEKPIAPDREQTLRIMRQAQEKERLLMICHVLRYHPLYARIKELLDSDAIGTLVSVHTRECIAWHHMATAFVRGRWRRREESNPILLAKCCHDIDLVAWFFSGIRPRQVSSFGGLQFYRPENAPPGAPARCTDGCPHEQTCPFSAPRLYVKKGLWGHHMFYLGETDEEKMRLLKTSPYGRCVFHCDNNVCDHQEVSIMFENGATASHYLTGLAAAASRTVHLCGTKGEIHGDLEKGLLTLQPLGEPEPTRIPFSGEQEEGLRGGHTGDDLLMADFVHAVDTITGKGNYNPASLDVRTAVADSLNGHLIIFAADQALRENRVVSIDDMV